MQAKQIDAIHVAIPKCVFDLCEPIICTLHNAHNRTEQNRTSKCAIITQPSAPKPCSFSSRTIFKITMNKWTETRVARTHERWTLHINDMRHCILSLSPYPYPIAAIQWLDYYYCFDYNLWWQLQRTTEIFKVSELTIICSMLKLFWASSSNLIVKRHFLPVSIFIFSQRTIFSNDLLFRDAWIMDCSLFRSF